MLKVHDLWVRYATGDWIIKGISFEAHQGELIVIAGPSGSGKSTLARTIAGFIPHFYDGEVKGEVDVFGNDPISMGIEKLIGLIGFFGQDPSLYTVTLNTESEIVYPLEIIGLSKEEIKRRLNYVAEALSIKHLIDRSLLELSSGELQKVVLASLIAMDSKILILDEPLARLDPISVRNISIILREIADEGKIVLVFEHHLDEILPLCDKVVVLNDGEITYYGDPKDSINHLKHIDIPEISEVFLHIGKDFDTIPITVKEAVDKLANIVN